jgi:hypothetical protein
MEVEIKALDSLVIDHNDKKKIPSFKRRPSCTYCGIIGYEESECRSKAAANSQKTSSFSSPQERNTAMKAMKAMKEKFDKRTHKPQTPPNRLRCRNCGGNHFASQCKVSLAEIKIC